MDENAEQAVFPLHGFSDFKLHPRPSRCVGPYQDYGDGSIVEMPEDHATDGLVALSLGVLVFGVIEEARHIWSRNDIRVTNLIGPEDVEFVVKGKEDASRHDVTSSEGRWRCR